MKTIFRQTFRKMEFIYSKYFIDVLFLGCPMHKSPGFPVSTPLNTTMEHGNLSSITKHPSTRKRMGSNAVAESVPDAKKSRSKLASRKIPSKGKKINPCA